MVRGRVQGTRCGRLTTARAASNQSVGPCTPSVSPGWRPVGAPETHGERSAGRRGAGARLLEPVPLVRPAWTSIARGGPRAGGSGDCALRRAVGARIIEAERSPQRRRVLPAARGHRSHRRSGPPWRGAVRIEAMTSTLIPVLLVAALSAGPSARRARGSRSTPLPTFSPRPGHIAVPYASTQQYSAEYARCRGRQIVAFSERPEQRQAGPA